MLELENICIKVSRKVFWAALTTIKNLLSTITPLQDAWEASTMFVSTVIDYAYTGGNMELVAAGTDLLIMLICVWNYKFWSYKESQSN